MHAAAQSSCNGRQWYTKIRVFDHDSANRSHPQHLHIYTFFPGLLGVTVPEQYGGAGLDAVAVRVSCLYRQSFRQGKIFETECVMIGEISELKKKKKLAQA